jgi:ketosteroid isomerase-like protein
VSRENVEIVRALAGAFRSRDHERPFDFYAADIEWDASLHPVPDVADVYRGHAGVRAFWRRWLSAWRDLEFELEDVLDAGDNVVMLVSNQRQMGRHSGIATEVPPYALVFTFRASKVVRFQFVPDQHEALKVVGLRE